MAELKKNSIQAAKHLKRILRILTFVFIIALIISVSACSNGENNNTNETGNATAASQNTSGSTAAETTADIMNLVPQQDLGGFEINFLTDIVWNWDFGPMHMEYVEQENGEPVNDAFYKRNSIIEDRLNVKINETVRMNNDANTQAKKMVKAGDNTYNVILGTSSGMGALAADGCFAELHEVPGLQLSQPWWDQHSIQDYSIQNKLYVMTGDYNLINNDATWMLYFNKTMTQDLGLDMPYDLVRQGKWTFDKMMDYQKAAMRDVDGNGVWTAEGDIWGHVTHTQDYTGLLFAAGESLVTKDADGLPVFVQGTERLNSVYNKIIKLMQTPGYTMNIYLNIKGLPADKHATYNFLNNEALFCSEILAHTRRFRQMESDFGILPQPKYDENQPEYHSYVLYQVTDTCIPTTNADLEKTATVLDALGMLSDYTIIPAYYQISYIGKFFRDDESIDMINIIRNSRVYNLADVYNWGGITGVYENAAVKATPLQSTMDKYRDKVNTAINKTLDAFGISY